MPKKPARSPVPKPKPITKSTDSGEWHRGADVEIHLYAKSLQKAAQILVATLDPGDHFKTAWDVGPVILLYRQAVELRLKLLVGEGGRFLASPTDSITLSTTHSIRWLAQIVCRIIRAVNWEAEFKCEGISSLEDFSMLVAELDSLDPVSAAIRADKSGLPGAIPASLQKSKIVNVVPKLDAMLDLLDAMTDGLAATVDLMELDAKPGQKQMVH